MSMNRSKYASNYRQRGAFSIMAAGTLALALLCLVLVVDSGRLYMEQRSLQRVADMAALEAVSRGGTCHNGTAVEFATQAATNNKLFQHGGELSGVECVDLATNERGIREVQRRNDDSPIIRVITTKTVPASLVIQAGCLLGACEREITLQAEAVAGKEEPIAAFSVGSRLIRFDNDSVLGGVLKFVGLDLDGVNVADYTGLVNLPITPDGLLRELGLPITTDLTVGGLNDLLAAKEVNVLELIKAAAKVVGQDALLDLGLDILDAVETNLKVGSLELTLPLLTQPDGTPGLFAEIIAPDTQNAGAALNTQLSALGILETAIGIATHEHALSVDSLNINLLGLVKVTTKVGVVEPPSIAIGAPTRRDANDTIVQEGAKAYTAQVRTYIHLKTGDVLGALNSLVDLLGISLIHIDLPITLDLVTGQGVLEENTCTPFAAAQTNHPGDHAEIAVSGEVLKLCIGEPIDESRLFSKAESCGAYLKGTNYLDILGLLKLDRTGGAPLSLDALSIEEDEVYLAVDTAELPANWTDMQDRSDFGTVGGNSLDIGTVVERLIGLLLDLLLGGSSQNNLQAPDDSTNREIAEGIWNAAAPPGGCPDTECRQQVMEDIKGKAETVHNDGLVTGLLTGLLNLVGNLLGDVLDLVDKLLKLLLGGVHHGNQCTTDSYRAGPLGSNLTNQHDTSDAACIDQIAKSLPADAGTQFSLGILTSLLDELGSKVLKPILENLLGLRVSEVDVHLQDLNCGHARLLQ